MCGIPVQFLGSFLVNKNCADDTGRQTPHDGERTPEKTHNIYIEKVEEISLSETPIFDKYGYFPTHHVNANFRIMKNDVLKYVLEQKIYFHSVKKHEITQQVFSNIYDSVFF